MKPGDIIEWVYVTDKKIVDHDEWCYSSMKDKIQIGGRMLLISIVDNHISFLRKEGMFHTTINEIRRPAWRTSGGKLIISHSCERTFLTGSAEVVPRVVEENPTIRINNVNETR